MRVVLHITAGGQGTARELGFDRSEVGGGGSTYRIGRHDEADVVVSDLSVSRLHFEIAEGAVGVVVRDLGSSSGTMLNGVRVSDERVLSNGDVIAFGEAVARVEIVDAVASVPQRGGVDSEAQTIVGAPWMRRPDAAGGPERANAVADAGLDVPAATLMASVDSEVSGGASGAIDIPLRGDSVVVGREDSCDVVLADQLVVSRRHADFRPDGRSWAVRDLGSSNGTFVNGSAVRRPTPLAVGDVVSIGSFQLRFTGHSLRGIGSDGTPGIVVDGLYMPKREGGYILNDVSFRVEHGELVGLIGMSGSGKTRLMYAMCGRAAFSAGKVLYEGRDLVSEFDSIKSSIGYVPSRLMLHEPLRVREALFAISRLRLAADVKNDEINGNITETLEMLGISHRADAAISTLSDGEKRRLGLAVELLAKPPVLLLDEVTTALDLPLHCKLMALFRELADRGQSLLLISHHIEDLELCDKWLYIVRGQVAFFGTPDGFCEHFGVGSLREQLDRQDSRPPEEWAAMFDNSAMAGGAASVGVDGDGSSPSESSVRRRRWGEIRRQVPLLMGRMGRLVSADRSSVRLVALLAPLVAAVIVLLNAALGAAADDALAAWEASPMNQVLWGEAVSTAKRQQSVVAYMLTVSAIVIASFLSVREIVKEEAIYGHERFAGLEILPYLIGKLVVMGAIAVAATLAVTMATTLFVGEEGLSARFVPLFLVLASLSLASTALALLISAASRSSEQAVFVLVPVLIMQLALSGAFPLAASDLALWVGRIGIVNYWAFNGILDTLDPVLIGGTDPEGFGTFDGEPFVLGLVMPWVHGAVYFTAAYVILLRKDGPGFVGRLRREFRTLVPPARAARDGIVGAARSSWEGRSG